MKAKDYQAMKHRLGLWDNTRMAVKMESEINRAVCKARREITERGTECPLCGWKPKRAKGSRK